MKWLLVVIVASTPVKTDLVYRMLADCLRGEESMRAEWADIQNGASGRAATKDTLDMVKRQMTFGTCIPTRAD